MCDALDEWAKLMSARNEDFAKAWREVRLAIRKSCLLDRTLYGGEKPSNTPCPVHQGRWSGVHVGWPGSKYADGSPAPEDEQCRKWFDAGCRCFQHSCACTTGWQPEATP